MKSFAHDILLNQANYSLNLRVVSWDHIELLHVLFRALQVLKINSFSCNTVHVLWSRMIQQREYLIYILKTWYDCLEAQTMNFPLHFCTTPFKILKVPMLRGAQGTMNFQLHFCTTHLKILKVPMQGGAQGTQSA